MNEGNKLISLSHYTISAFKILNLMNLLLLADFYHVILIANPPHLHFQLFMSIKDGQGTHRSHTCDVSIREDQAPFLVHHETSAQGHCCLLIFKADHESHLKCTQLTRSMLVLSACVNPLDPLDTSITSITSSTLSATIAGCTAEITSAQDTQTVQVPQLLRSPKSTSSLFR